MWQLYLKALEIQGFKSFPDKTVLTFDRDVTSIVGPNGSGKSNISDAVRWVLGEQSTKQLRGSRMEDVIFGGTPKRSQLGFAEVSLILDNTAGELGYDAAEVMITRRYYRSGEGEYFINRQSARLKDVNELFMDTGLGREGYSNISQGRIDEILSLKSTDRREIFEEAAGISKYRYRKEEAQRRLSNTQDNLVRLGDKIAELELQVTPLKEQSEVARRYLLLRDSLKGLEVSQWLTSLEELVEQGQKTQEDCRAANCQLEQSNQALEQLYREAEDLSQALRQQDDALQAIRDQQQELERQRAEAERECAVLRTNLENNAQNIGRLELEGREQTDRSGSLAQQIEERQARLAELDAMAQADEAARGETLSSYDRLTRQVQALNEETDQVAGSQKQLETLIGDLRTQLSACTGSEQTLMDRETAVLQERSQLLLRRDAGENQVRATQAALEEANARLTKARNQEAGFALRESSRQSALEQCSRRLSELSVERKTLQAKQALLVEMQREYEGYSRAVKLVLQERDRGGLQGVLGPVPELLKTRDDYAVAIETALGSAMQSIVVETQAVGKAAIGLLKSRNAGRATFLPLSVIEGRTLNEKNLSQNPGYLGLACELIDYDPRYDGVMRSLLGRTAVTDTLDHAVQLANRCGHRFRIVTLDGQVLNAGGAMTGGSTANTAGVLSRANELARLEERGQQLRERETAAQQAVTEAQKALLETRREAEAAREGLQAAKDDLSQVTEQLGRQELLLQTLDEALNGAKAELEGLGGKLTSGRDQAGQLEQRIAAVTRDREALETRLEGLRAQRQTLETAQAAAMEELTRLRLEDSARQAERTAAQTSLEQLEGLQTAMVGDASRRQSLIDDYLAKNQTLQGQIAALEAQAQALAGRSEAARQRSAQAMEERARTEMKKTSAQRQQQEANKNILLMERECARLEQKRAAAALQEKQLSDKLWENYELTVSTAAPLRQPVTPQTVKEIDRLRRQIGSLGTPNLGAIEEYERVNERYTYLTTQRDDVLQSRTELLGVIDKLTGEMTAIFSREFRHIREAFAETFAELFGGGRANLELEDPDSILECGIEIQVQPPGKQLKTITLLSGGEKAFVAIALYFAILKVRPTPFCILDEIDAALDDRNVARFAAYVRRLTGDTQFILITHRRGTMEASDVLYGVTMTEQGVSRMLTLDLDRVEAELHMTTT